jgi:type IV pilus assembly protein PilF
MHLKTLKVSVILLAVATLSACQTTSNSKISSSGTQSSSSNDSDFDRQKAAQVRLSAGLKYLRNGSLQNAKRHLDKALELSDDNANVHFGIAYYFEQVKELDLAEKSYKKALRLEPKNPDFLNGYASFLCGKKNYQKADEYFNRAIEQPIYPSIASAYMNAGVCAKLNGNVKKATSYFRKALNRDNKLPRALIEMAEVEYERKRYERAHSYMKRYEEVSKPSSNSLWLALRVAFFRNDKDSLASYAIKLEQLYPDSDETAAYLDSKDQWM